jgi:protein TonB
MLFDQRRAGARHGGRGVAGAAVVHCALAALAVAVARYEAAPGDGRPASVAIPVQMVWIPTDAPTGGGGAGGGDRRPDPPRRAEARGSDPMTVPSAPPAPVATEAAAPEPEQTLALSAEPLAAGAAPLVGVVEPAAAAAAFGAGDGPGAGGGDGGPGIGPGRGPGSGGGDGGETGEVGPPGNGVSWPRLLRDVKPAYTAEAMRARIVGSVGLSCVVDRDGSVRDCRLTRSLDRHLGLDDAALRAARLWRFLPARRLNEAVPVRVTIDMDFSLR